MANDFSEDARCKALWKLEDGALTADSQGTNTLTASANPPTSDLVDFKEGAACGVFVNASHQFLKIANASLDSGFPLKYGEDVTKKITACGWVKFGTLPVATGEVDHYHGIFGYPRSNISGRMFGVAVSAGLRAPEYTEEYCALDIDYHLARLCAPYRHRGRNG